MSTICKVELPFLDVRNDGLLYQVDTGANGVKSRAAALDMAMGNVKRLGATKGCRVRVCLVNREMTTIVFIGYATLK